MRDKLSLQKTETLFSKPTETVNNHPPNSTTQINGARVVACLEVAATLDEVREDLLLPLLALLPHLLRALEGPVPHLCGDKSQED
jgi:hypothetical protein